MQIDRFPDQDLYKLATYTITVTGLGRRRPHTGLTSIDGAWQRLTAAPVAVSIVLDRLRTPSRPISTDSGR